MPIYESHISEAQYDPMALVKQFKPFDLMEAIDRAHAYANEATLSQMKIQSLQREQQLDAQLMPAKLAEAKLKMMEAQRDMQLVQIESGPEWAKSQVELKKTQAQAELEKIQAQRDDINAQVEQRKMVSDKIKSDLQKKQLSADQDKDITDLANRKARSLDSEPTYEDTTRKIGKTSIDELLNRPSLGRRMGTAIGEGMNWAGKALETVATLGLTQIEGGQIKAGPFVKPFVTSDFDKAVSADIDDIVSKINSSDEKAVAKEKLATPEFQKKLSAAKQAVIDKSDDGTKLNELIHNTIVGHTGMLKDEFAKEHAEWKKEDDAIQMEIDRKMKIKELVNVFDMDPKAAAALASANQKMEAFKLKQAAKAQGNALVMSVPSAKGGTSSLQDGVMMWSPPDATGQRTQGMVPQDQVQSAMIQGATLQ